MAEEKMYTISEIAQIFRVSRKTVYEWVAPGKNAWIKTPSSVTRGPKISLG